MDESSIEHPILAILREALQVTGLNLLGVVDPTRYDAEVPVARRTASLCPRARAIIVVASGGPALWRAFEQHLRTDALALTGEPHPLDAFVRRAVGLADGRLGALERRWFFAAANADVHLDFRVLGYVAGLGIRSRLGLLLNDTYGPWMGLRAACFVADDIPCSELPSGDPCLECPGYCVEACPGNAFPNGTWDVDRCGAFHLEDTRCAHTCHARVACPVGATQSYDPEARAYHYNRAEGRRLLREKLGIPEGADPFSGEGPHWGSWRSRIDVKGVGLNE